jgi:small subunit ribosomal protein S18
MNALGKADFSKANMYVPEQSSRFFFSRSSSFNQFLKPADLLVREDPFRRRRALLGPGASESRQNDWFYQLGIDPLDEATNPRLLSYFVTDMGKVKNRAETKLTWRNQRRLAKAIRRAKMMGIMPILNKQVSSYKGGALM